ncbi:transmembrane protein 258-like [Paramacrobiotus metropolitanus]|uniref:transmembrane protein 258-like n=1 Tax=Paramacrobiotus metropolitanus TaxID=2943436 RepID=UPI002445E859|nr:transmembrane protein 258-like [Paramacrobiotus metropolitanus]
MEIPKSEFFDVSTYSRYSGPVDAAIIPLMSYLLLGAGFFFMAYFFVYEVTSTKSSRELRKEILVATLAALFLGVGTVFALLLVGIYV